MAGISKNFLNSSCKYRHVTGRNSDRVETFQDFDLSKVYIYFTRADSDGSNGKAPADTLIMFYDVENSETSGESLPPFAPGDVVEFDGRRFTVFSVAPRKGFKGVEHYEIGAQ